MPVKIRLMRIGAKKRPFYRVVAVDERNKRDGEYLELLGTYNPLTTPHEVILKQEQIDQWLKKGAVMSEGFLRVIGKAPQRPARKAKRENQSKVSEPAPTSEPITAEKAIETANESVETPIETVETSTENVDSGTEAPSEEVSQPNTSDSESTTNEEVSEEVK